MDSSLKNKPITVGENIVYFYEQTDLKIINDLDEIITIKDISESKNYGAVFLPRDNYFNDDYITPDNDIFNYIPEEPILSAPAYDPESTSEESNFSSGEHENNPDTVIGADGRVKMSSTTSPGKYILHLEMWFDFDKNGIIYTGTDPNKYETFYGTGFICGYDNVFLTAGHNVYDRNKDCYVSTIKIRTQQNASTLKSSYFSGYSWTFTSNYKNTISDTDALKYDWAVGSIKGTFGLGHMGYNTGIPPASSSSPVITVSGYPGEYCFYLYTHSDALKNYTTENLQYYTDTSAGQSGSPCYSNTTAYAIHVARSVDYSYNIGTRINSNIINWMGISASL